MIFVAAQGCDSFALPERVQCRGEKNHTLLTAGHAPPVIALATRRKRRLEKEKIVHEQLVACATPLAATRMDMHFSANIRNEALPISHPFRGPPDTD